MYIIVCFAPYTCKQPNLVLFSVIWQLQYFLIQLQSKIDFQSNFAAPFLSLFGLFILIYFIYVVVSSTIVTWNVCTHFGSKKGTNVILSVSFIPFSNIVPVVSFFLLLDGVSWSISERLFEWIYLFVTSGGR